MNISSKSVSRLVSAFIYLAMAAAVVWAGSGLVDYSLDTKFYKDYLLKWEVSINALNTKNEPWPEFSENDQVHYMDKVVRMMVRHNIAVPVSNTKYPFLYQLKRVWGKTDEIFVLCFQNRIFLYGISKKTLEKIDVYVDGVSDLSKGNLTGGMKNSHGHYTGKLIL
ncbi:MAG: hypothetical protein KJ737_05635 [Proteobacteria bacterium]|nr:hypothetical protein [Pseudomonadota bacterium]